MISREAGDKQKGFRLQKIRAIVLMLELIETVDRPHLYSATEYMEDVYLKSASPGFEKEIFEEDKNYDPSTTFTFNNPTLRNSVVSFIDIWLDKGKGISKNMSFAFYSTNQIAKEKKSTWTKKLSIDLPEKALLEKITNKELDNDVLEAVKKYMLEEYRCQYQDKDTNGYFSVIEKWSNDDWKKFLEKINWLFRQPDEKKLKDKVVEKIGKCKFFSEQECSGMEGQIFDSLMELFDSRMDVEDPSDRFVYSGDFKNIFQDIIINSLSSGVTTTKSSDPVWQMWNKIPDPTDKRNISEKIKAVCPDFTDRALEKLAIKVTRNYVDTQDIESNKDFLSFRYRVYDQCSDTLYDIVKSHDSTVTITEDILHAWIKQMRDSACVTMQDLSKDFHYKRNNNVMIEGVILELFDTCFLSFDYA